MEGVTTAIVAFLFVCIVFPVIVKNKPQYYAAFGAVVLIILLLGLDTVVSSPKFHAFATFITCLLQVAAMLLLTLAAGGLTVRQLAGEITDAIEVMRRGETTKEVIIPIKGSMPSAARPPAPRPSGAQAEPHAYTLDNPTPPKAARDTDSSVPLE